MISLEQHVKMAEMLCKIRATLTYEYCHGERPKTQKQHESKALKYLESVRSALDEITYRDFGRIDIYYPCKDEVYKEYMEKEMMDTIRAFITLMLVRDDSSVVSIRDIYDAYRWFMNALNLTPVSYNRFHKIAIPKILQIDGVETGRDVVMGIRLRE